MEEYIKKQDALNALYRAQRDVTWSMDHVDTMDQMIDYVEKLPPEDIKPTKHGKWISASTKPGVQIGMKCSICGARIKYSEFFNGNHNYCHKCGAKMDKEKSDASYL